MAAGSADRAKNSKMAADLVKRGIWHGRLMTKGLTNIPANASDSAAYRRLMDGKRA